MITRPDSSLPSSSFRMLCCAWRKKWYAKPPAHSTQNSMCITDTLFQMKLPVTRGLNPTSRVSNAGIIYTTTQNSASGSFTCTTAARAKNADMSKLQARHKPGAQGTPVGAIAWKREEQAWPEAGARLVGQDPEGRAGCRGRRLSAARAELKRRGRARGAGLRWRGGAGGAELRWRGGARGLGFGGARLAGAGLIWRGRG